MDKTHAEQLQIYMETLGQAHDLENKYLYGIIQKMIATFIRSQHRVYRRGAE